MSANFNFHHYFLHRYSVVSFKGEREFYFITQTSQEEVLKNRNSEPPGGEKAGLMES